MTPPEKVQQSYNFYLIWTLSRILQHVIEDSHNSQGGALYYVS